MKLRLALLAAVLFAATNLAAAHAQEDEGFSVSFSVVDLGPIEHPDHDACDDIAPGATVAAIAAGSRAVGSIYFDDERAVAALLSADGVRTMESGPGGGVANAINRENVIAGAIYSQRPDEPCGRPSGASPAVWDEDFELRTLDLPEEATSGAATAINVNGAVAGWVNTDAGRRAALWHDDDIVVISHAGIEGIERLTSIATDINESGLVTGTMAWTEGETRHQRPFIWDGVTVQYPDPTQGQDGFANAINDDGVVAGAVIGRDTFEQATLWWRGQITDLPNLPDRPASVATDINNGGVVVGYCAREDGLSRASIWINGEVVDLNEIIPQDLGWQLQVAVGINDDGLIAGWGDLDGVTHAFMLVPAAG
ncbi:MAG: DUF3466 family protein [Thermomicrobiales bacterium]|nr:DUF3466 family protein [Thermomicrobiales bacterium]